jgi:type I restriction enzyme S subunit
VNWQSVRLAELSKVITKGTTPTSIGFEFSNDGIRFLRVQNIEGGIVNYERDTLFIDESTHQALKRSQIQPGDILVSIAGTIGRSGVVPEDSPPLNCNQAVAIVRTNGGVFRPYLRNWLESSDAQRQMIGAAVTGTISNLSLAQVGNLMVPVPSLAEQRQIAEVLDRAEALRAKRRSALAQLDTLTQSIFLDLFGDPATNPKAWPENKSLGEVADIVSGVTKGRSLQGKSTREVPYLAVVNVQDRFLNMSTVKKIEVTEAEIQQFKLLPDDLLLTEGGDRSGTASSLSASTRTMCSASGSNQRTFILYF